MFVAVAGIPALASSVFSNGPVPFAAVVTPTLLVVVSLIVFCGYARRSASDKDSGVVTLPEIVSAAAAAGAGVAVGAGVGVDVGTGVGVGVGDVQPDSAIAANNTTRTVIITGTLLEFIEIHL
jgi:hypothetical protein